MRYFYFLIAASFFLNVISEKSYASPYVTKEKTINFENVEKKAEGWKYFLDGQEIPYLPEIFVKGIVKYVPVDIVKNLGAELIFDSENKTAYITNNEETFVVKENSKQIYVNNKIFIVPDEPIWKNNTLYVSTFFLSRFGVLLYENKFKYELNIVKKFNMLNDFTVNFDNIENNITFNLNTIPVYNFYKEKDFFRITFFGTIAKEPEVLKTKLNSFSSYFKKIDLDYSRKGILVLTFFPKTSTAGTINTFTLEKKNALVVQIHKIFHHEERELTKDGVYYSKLTKGDFQGPLKINVLEINTNKGWFIRPEVSRNEKLHFSLREVSRFAKDFGAFAAVNGGFFSPKTDQPQGLLIINGELLSPPLYNRSALIISKDETYHIRNVDLTIHLKVSTGDGNNKVFKINSFNQMPGKNQITLFDNLFTPDSDIQETNNLKNDSNKNNEIPAINNEITSFLVSKTSLSKITDFKSQIKGESFILFASGTAREELEKVHQNVTECEVSFKYSEPLENILHAIGGGPTLIKNGELDITAQQEKFKPDITEGRAPRTAFAILKNNRVLLVTVDGRQESSRGFSLEELAYFLKQYEALDAVNFDGGGSTTMYFNGELVNSTSDGKERKVSNALLLFKK